MSSPLTLAFNMAPKMTGMQSCEPIFTGERRLIGKGQRPRRDEQILQALEAGMSEAELVEYFRVVPLTIRKAATRGRTARAEHRLAELRERVALIGAWEKLTGRSFQELREKLRKERDAIARALYMPRPSSLKPPAATDANDPFQPQGICASASPDVGA